MKRDGFFFFCGEPYIDIAQNWGNYALQFVKALRNTLTVSSGPHG